MSSSPQQLPQNIEGGYPPYPIDEAMKVASALRDLGGAKAPVQKDFLAKHMNFAPTGPSFVQRLGAARIFGLIDGRGEYQLTPLARRYFYPSSHDDKLDALREMMHQPRAFRVVLERFENAEFPDHEIIGNIMHNNADVPESWKNKVAAIFERSVEAIGPDALKPGYVRVEGTSKRETVAEQGTPKPKSQEANSNTHSFDMPLVNNRKVTVTAPIDLTETEMKRLQAWLPLTFLVDWKPEDKN